jgi:hypothetical protein
MSVPHLLAAATEQSQPLSRGFLLVEPATVQYEPFVEALAMHPCTPRLLAHREELMPRLIDVASLPSDAQVEVTELWLAEANAERPPVVCAWLDCDVGIDELAAHIAHYLVGPGADGKPVFWRYYDPRVLSLVAAVFDSEQSAALMGPIKEWQFPWAGHRWSISGRGPVADESANDARGWPRTDQWPRIDRSNLKTRVVERLRALSVESAARLPSELDGIFCEAERLGGLGDANELVDYAWHCAHYGSAFTEHPRLMEALPALARRDTTWFDVRATFTPQDFQALEKAAHSRQT